jgi:hypothetical protein
MLHKMQHFVKKMVGSALPETKRLSIPGTDYSGRVPDPDAGFACGSVVLFYLFHEMLARRANIS